MDREQAYNPKMYLQCMACGTLAFADEFYCTGCGNPLGSVCSHCGEEHLHLQAEFCPFCGESFFLDKQENTDDASTKQE